MKKYTHSDWTQMILPHSAQFSPDGKYVAFMVRIPDAKNDTYMSKIYITNPKTGKTKKLTNNGDENAFTWSGNKNIVFSSTRDSGDKKKKESGELLTVFYEISIDGGEAEEVFRVSLPGATPTKVSKNTYLLRSYYDTTYPNLTNLTGKKRTDAIATYKEQGDYEVYDEFPYRFDGMGYINKKRSRLYTYNTVSKKLTEITAKMFSTGANTFNADMSKLYYAGEEYTVESSNTTGIYSYDFKTGVKEELLSVGKYAVAGIAVTNTHIYFTASVFKKVMTIGEMNMYSLDLKSKKIEMVYTPEGDFGFGLVCDGVKGDGFSFKAYDNELYFIETRRISSNLYRLSDGKAVQVNDDTLKIASFDISLSGIVALAVTQDKPAEYFAIDEREYRQITKLNDKFVKTYIISTPEPMTFVNSDGIEIDGWVIKPVGYEKGKKYPGFLEVHGGPRANYSSQLMLDLQFLAAEGYFVFYANPRGSSARGNDFANINEKYGTVDYRDLMEFTDEVLKKYPDMDKNRLGIGGGSYGGFMSNWVIGQTNRFHAAIPQCSISNWITMFGCSDIPNFCESQMNGTPWNNYDGLWNASPLKYADKVKTPTLFLQYASDFRCPMDQAVQMYTALMYHGVADTRMVMFAGDSHKLRSLGKPTHRVRRTEEILKWLGKYLAK